MNSNPKTSVLIVDDHADLGRAMVTLLKLGGYEASRVEDGEKALASIRLSPPSLVLLDVMMPGLSGIDVLRAIRSEPGMADQPVVVYSSLDDPTCRRQALDLGAREYVVKGRLDGESLRVLVERHANVGAGPLQAVASSVR